MDLDPLDFLPDPNDFDRPRDWFAFMLVVALLLLAVWGAAKAWDHYTRPDRRAAGAGPHITRHLPGAP